MKGNNFAKAARKLARGKIILILICFKLCASISLLLPGLPRIRKHFFVFHFTPAPNCCLKIIRIILQLFNSGQSAPTKATKLILLEHTHTHTNYCSFRWLLENGGFPASNKSTSRFRASSNRNVCVYVFCFKPRTRITPEKNCSKREQTNPNGWTKVSSSGTGENVVNLSTDCKRWGWTKHFTLPWNHSGLTEWAYN